MKVAGKCEIETFENEKFIIRINKEDHDIFAPIVRAELKNPGKVYNFSISSRVHFSTVTGKKSTLFVDLLDFPIVRLENIKFKRTTKQHRTLRGIERFIFIAENGYEPAKGDLHWIHEGLLEKYSVWENNPRTGISAPKRTSDQSMSTTEMARIVQGGLDSLASMDIPKNILDSIGDNMQKLWQAWYEWRYNGEDPLFNLESGMNWKQYLENHPVCELCGLKGTPENPLERMHIVSKGSSIVDYELPWNWLACHRSHHILQHSEGWEIIKKSYPHIVGKLNRAKIIQGEKNAEMGN